MAGLAKNVFSTRNPEAEKNNLEFEFACASEHQPKMDKHEPCEVGSSEVVEEEAPETENQSKEEDPGMSSADHGGDSDMDEVLAESTQIVVGNRILIKPEFFQIYGDNATSRAGARDRERYSVSGEDNIDFDATPPSRNQVIGSTPEYLDQLKLNTEKESELQQPLVPIFKMENMLKPRYMYWNYPRAVVDYEMMERWMVSIIPSGAVKKLICREGRDEKLVAGDNVLINYYLYVEGSAYCVESNKRRRKPHCFVLGRKRGGIPVIDLGTLSMRVKEISAFLATPEYGFGQLGVAGNPWIPANRRVLCIIEVLSRLASPLESSSIMNLVPTERKLLRFEEIYEFAMHRKLDGNKDLANGKIARALRKYFQAITCLDDANATNPTQQHAQEDLLFSLFTNAAICGIRTHQMEIVVEFSQKCLQLPLSEDTKGSVHLRCAKALYRTGDWRKAKEHLDTALERLEAGSSGEKYARELASQIAELAKEEQSEQGSSSSDTSSTATMYSACSELSPEEQDAPLEKGNKGKKKKRALCGGGSLLHRFSTELSSSSSSN